MKPLSATICCLLCLFAFLAMGQPTSNDQEVIFQYNQWLTNTPLNGLFYAKKIVSYNAIGHKVHELTLYTDLPKDSLKMMGAQWEYRKKRMKAQGQDLPTLLLRKFAYYQGIAPKKAQVKLTAPIKGYFAVTIFEQDGTVKVKEDYTITKNVTLWPFDITKVNYELFNYFSTSVPHASIKDTFLPTIKELLLRKIASTHNSSPKVEENIRSPYHWQITISGIKGVVTKKLMNSSL